MLANIIVIISKSFSITFLVSFVSLFSGEGREQAVLGTVRCHPSKLAVDGRILLVSMLLGFGFLVAG